MIEPGTIVAERYEVICRIGEGGMGEVYEARHVEIGKRVAIKFLSRDFAGDEQTTKRFHQEARIAGNLGQENICEVTDYGRTDDGLPFIVMELLEGETLAEVIRRDGALPTQRALAILHQVLAAIEEAHAHGILHRDLKPENVFLARRKQGEVVKLLDFGISKIVEPGGERMSLTKTGAMVGTPFYMSPEHVRGLKDVDHRTDIYSCGVMLYEMVTGRRPFDGTSFNEVMFKIVEEPFPVPEVDLPESVLEAIRTAMERDPEDRFQDAAEFRERVADILGTALGDLIPPGTATLEKRRSDLEKGKWKRISVFVLAPIIALLLIATVALVVLRSRSTETPVGSTGLYPIPDGDKWGFVDEKGTLAIPAIFDNVGDFSEGYVKALAGEKWGYVSAGGMMLIQPAYEKAGDFHEGLAAVLLDGKWGFVDRRGTVAIAAIFDEAGDFSEGLAAIRSGEKWGYVDAGGKVVVSPQFLAAGRFNEERAAVATAGGWGFVDPSGELVVADTYDFTGPFSEGLARMKVCSPDSTEFCKWGFVDVAGKEAIGPGFDWAYDFSEGLALVMADGRWGYVGKKGHFEIQPSFANAAPFSSGLARVKTGGRWGFIDRSGSWVVQPRYYLVGDFEGTLAAVTYVTRIPRGQDNAMETATGYVDAGGAFVWNAPEKDLSDEVPPGNRKMWNFDFLTGKIRVIGSFDPTTYELKFREEEGTFTTVPLDLPHPLELGSIKTVYPAESYTLVLSDNVLALTLGWAAIVHGETSLLKTRVQGKEVITNVSALPLTEDARGKGLMGWALGKRRVYLLTRAGKLKYKDLEDIYGGLMEHILAREPSPHCVIHYHDGFVFLFEPGASYTVFRDEEDRIEAFERELGFTANAAAEIEEGPEGLVVRFGDQELRIAPGQLQEWWESRDVE